MIQSTISIRAQRSVPGFPALPLLLFGLVGSAVAEEAADIEAIVKRLGSVEFEEREAAEAELFAMGEGILPILERLGRTGHLEIDLRLERLRERIRDARFGRHAEELRWLEAALEANPHDGWARLRLGWLLHYDLGELEAAAHHLRLVAEAADLDPSYRAAALNGLAETYRERREFDRAIEIHEQGVSVAPTALGLHNLAWVYNTHRRDFDRAVALCERALEIDPDDEFPRISLAVFLANRGDAARAREIVGSVDKSDSIRHYNLAVYHAISGQPEEALRFVRSYLYEYLVVVEKRDQVRRYMLEDWHLASLREDPKFQELMKMEGEESK